MSAPGDMVRHGARGGARGGSLQVSAEEAHHGPRKNMENLPEHHGKIDIERL